MGAQMIASRFEQPHLPRLRAAGGAFEVVAADLAPNQVAATQIFAKEDVSLSPELAAALSERTEGFPAGLHLAATMAKNSQGQLGVTSGDDRYVGDHFYRVSLSRLPARMQWFLRATAALDRVCGPLRDALLEPSDGVGKLRWLEASSVFVIPLGRRRHWYRYHALFREFLLGELRRRTSAGEIGEAAPECGRYEVGGAPWIRIRKHDGHQRPGCKSAAHPNVLAAKGRAVESPWV
jgi:LuxR family maltose regulon positive regulatory protein